MKTSAAPPLKPWPEVLGKLAHALTIGALRILCIAGSVWLGMSWVGCCC